MQSFVPKPIPTPISKIFYYRYHVTQDVVDYLGQTVSSEFNEIYRIKFIDDQLINFTSVLDFTFYQSCGKAEPKNWYMENKVEYSSRLIIGNWTTPTDNMDYVNKHMRLFASLGVSVGETMKSNNIELGYRWGISSLHDLTMTRGKDIIYPFKYNEFDAMTFSGSDAIEGISGIPS